MKFYWISNQAVMEGWNNYLRNEVFERLHDAWTLRLLEVAEAAGCNNCSSENKAKIHLQSHKGCTYSVTANYRSEISNAMCTKAHTVTKQQQWNRHGQYYTITLHNNDNMTPYVVTPSSNWGVYFLLGLKAKFWPDVVLTPTMVKQRQPQPSTLGLPSMQAPLLHLPVQFYKLTS